MKRLQVAKISNSVSPFASHTIAPHAPKDSSLMRGGGEDGEGEELILELTTSLDKLLAEGGKAKMLFEIDLVSLSCVDVFLQCLF